MVENGTYLIKLFQGSILALNVMKKKVFTKICRILRSTLGASTCSSFALAPLGY